MVSEVEKLIQPKDYLISLPCHSHTDLGSWSGKIPAPYPCILGHEGAGKVIAVGKQYESVFSPGDSVIASFCSCGKCESCQRLQPACCEQFLPLNLAFQDHSNQPVKVLYEDENNQTKEAYSKYFGQSSFANIMPVSGRSVGFHFRLMHANLSEAILIQIATSYSAYPYLGENSSEICMCSCLRLSNRILYRSRKSKRSDRKKQKF